MRDLQTMRSDNRAASRKWITRAHTKPVRQTLIEIEEASNQLLDGLVREIKAGRLTKADAAETLAGRFERGTFTVRLPALDKSAIAACLEDF